MAKFVLEFKREKRNQKVTMDAKDVPEALVLFWESIPAGQPWPSVTAINGVNFVEPLDRVPTKKPEERF